ncbi:hypothetical protein ACO0RG_001723 [Hanseniaspora osmophila]
MLAVIQNIQNTISDIQENIDAILKDQEHIQLEIENDPKFNELFLAKGQENDNSTAIIAHETKNPTIDKKSDILSKDQEYITQIEVLRSLQLIARLIEEFEKCLAKWSFEDAYVKLQQMCEKHKTLWQSFPLQLSLQLQKSLTSKLDELHLDFLEKLVKVYKFFFQTNEDKNELVLNVVSEDGNVSLKDVHTFVVSSLLEHKNIENVTKENSTLFIDTWFIDSIVDSNSVMEHCLSLMNGVAIKYIKLNNIIDRYIKYVLFHNSVCLSITKNSGLCWSVETSTLSSNEKVLFERQVENMQNVAALYDFLMVQNQEYYNFSKLSQTLVKQFENFIKLNVKPLWNKETNFKKEIIKIVEKSETLSRSNLLNILLDRSGNTYNSIIMDKLIREGFVELRNLFSDTTVLEKTRFVSLPRKVNDEAYLENSNEEISVKKIESQKSDISESELDDGWGWEDDVLEDNNDQSFEADTTIREDSVELPHKSNQMTLPEKSATTTKKTKNTDWADSLNEEELEADDGWNVDDDMLSLNDNKSSHEPAHKNTGTGKDSEYGDETDAWSINESLNLDDDAEMQKSESKKSDDKDVLETKGKVAHDEFHVSEATFKFLECWKLLNTRIANELPSCNSSEINKEYRLNLLLTSYYAMCTSQYDGDWTKYVNDIEYLKFEFSHNKDFQESAVSNISQLFHLSNNLVDNKMQMIEKRLYSLTFLQLKIIKNHESMGDPDWSVTFDELLPFLSSIFHNQILHVGVLEKKIQMVLEMTAFFYEKCIIKPVSEWNVISEIASENISELIQLISQNLDDILLNFFTQESVSKPHRQQFMNLRERVTLVAKVLTARLKDIMEMFYNGDFYLFETNEIVNWLVLLFADTRKRSDCIEEIKAIRAEAESEQS